MKSGLVLSLACKQELGERTRPYWPWQPHKTNDAKKVNTSCFCSFLYQNEIMLKSCCVADCTNNKAKNAKLKFYVLPVKKSRRDKWLAAIKKTKVVKQTTDNGKETRKQTSKKS